MRTEQIAEARPVGERLLTAQQTMNILQVSRSNLYRMTRSGVLHPLYIGRLVRYTTAEVRRYMRALRASKKKGRTAKASPRAARSGASRRARNAGRDRKLRSATSRGPARKKKLNK